MRPSFPLPSLLPGDEGVPEKPPTLAQFKEQVDSYEKVYTEVEKFEVRRLYRLC